MLNFDKMMTNVESKSSHRESKGSRVGGGGTIAAKPPRNPSGLVGTSKPELSELNVSGVAAS